MHILKMQIDVSLSKSTAACFVSNSLKNSFQISVMSYKLLDFSMFESA